MISASIMLAQGNITFQNKKTYRITQVPDRSENPY